MSPPPFSSSSSLEALLKEWKLLKKRKAVRISCMGYPDGVERSTKIRTDTANKKNEIKQLKIDLKILNDRINKEKAKLKRKRLGY